LSTESRLGSPSSPAESIDDPLAAIDDILEQRAERLEEVADQGEQEASRRIEFLDDFASFRGRVIRPGMEAVLERLRRDGGGGFIEEHSGSEPRYRLPGLTLWLSLEGEVPSEGREDRFPYLRLDADAAHRVVKVAAGDMWQGGGTHTSGPAGTWVLDEITVDLVEHTIVDLLRRSAT
jgi:hypothetical protein